MPQINRRTANFDLKKDGKPAEELKGSLDGEGIIPRAIRELFHQVEQKRADSQGKSKITVKVQYI